CARHPHSLVLAETRLRVLRRAEQARKDDGVFDRLGCTLPDVERHRVRGVAEESHAALAPPFLRIAVVQVATSHRSFVRRGDDLLDWFRPSSKTYEKALPTPTFRILLSFGGVRDSKPVDLRLAHAVVRKALAWSVRDRQDADL